MVVGVRGPTGDWTPVYVLCLHQTCQGPNTIPVLQCDKSDREPSLASVPLAGLIGKQHHIGRVRRHWRPHSDDRSLLPCPSKRFPRSEADFLHSIILGAGCFWCMLSFFYRHFTLLRGGKDLGSGRLVLPRNPAHLLLINVYSQHQTH